MAEGIKFFQTSVTVTNASTVISTAKDKGRDVVLQNNDLVGVVYVNLSGTAVADGTNIKILPGWSLELRGCTNQIAAIGDIASNANVALLEAW